MNELATRRPTPGLILITDPEAPNALLRTVGPDRDLVDEPEPLAAGWPAWDLDTALRGLRGWGWTKRRS